LITNRRCPAAIAERSTALPAGLAEDDVAAPGFAARCRIAALRPDDQVGQAVAIDVAGDETLQPLRSPAH
jgi:hypothetical protein